MHLGLALLALGIVGSGWQEAPSGAALQYLEHRPPPCMDTEKFPLIEAEASTPEAAQRLSRLAVRFRAEGDAGWYEIGFQPERGGALQAVLPKPLPEAVRVRYYIAEGRPEHRSPEYVVNVLRGGCPGARGAAAEPDEKIRVRRTLNEQPQVPRGFSPDGLESGGGMSGTTIGIAAGAAGGAGIAALALMGGEEPVPDTPGVANPQALRACFAPDPIPDIDSGATILFDASCTSPSTATSYFWNFGDGRAGEGTSVEHLFRPGGVYTVTLTVREGQRSDSISRLVRVRATPTACFDTSPDPPRILANESISFNAECSVGDRDGGPTTITSYVWDFGDGRPGAEGRFVSRQFTRPDLYGVSLTVTNPDGRQDKTTQFIVVERRTSVTPTPEVAFTSHLELPPGTGAQVSLNDAETVATASPLPLEHRARARSGENVVEGRLLAAAREPGRWRFEFRNEPRFVPGSLRVDSGEVLTLDRYSVVFRVTGDSGPPMRFRFRLEE